TCSTSRQMLSASPGSLSRRYRSAFLSASGTASLCNGFRLNMGFPLYDRSARFALRPACVNIRVALLANTTRPLTRAVLCAGKALSAYSCAGAHFAHRTACVSTRKHAGRTRGEYDRAYARGSVRGFCSSLALPAEDEIDEPFERIVELVDDALLERDD